jgi:acyl-coenzyme A synthetase/AMP-(fatty) acid ligase
MVNLEKIYFEEPCSIKEEVFKLINRLLSKDNIVLLTSGTTGKPKEICIDSNKILEKNRIGSTDEKWLLTFNPNRWSGVSVISHILKSNCSLYVPKTHEYKDLIECGFKNKTTHISLTPSLFRTILLNDSSDKFKNISFKQITFGGEVAKQSILNTAKKTFPEARITQVYASTETGDICSVSDCLEGIPKYKLEKDNFKFNSKNELIVNGFNTQDVWELDESSSRYYFKGRIKEIINVGGIKISPHKVEESALEEGADFAKAYSIGNPILGSLVCLEYVGNISEKDLKIRLKEKLSKYEMPAKFIKLERIELTEAGKLQRITKE